MSAPHTFTPLGPAVLLFTTESLSSLRLDAFFKILFLIMEIYVFLCGSVHMNRGVHRGHQRSSGSPGAGVGSHLIWAVCDINH